MSRSIRLLLPLLLLAALATPARAEAPLPAELERIDGLVLALDSRSGRVLMLSGDPALLDTRLPCGSLIKPLLLLAAYNTGRFDFNRTLFCSPRPLSAPADSRCWLAAGHGEVGLEQALAQSCNTYFLAVARQTDWEAFAQALRQVRIEPPLPPDDPAGLMIGLDPALMARPAELLAAYNALFNGGLLWALDPRQPQSGGRVASRIDLGQLDLERVRAGLRLCASAGTASAVGRRCPELSALAKTGTAPTPSLHAQHGWCVVLSPAASPSVGLIVFTRQGSGPDLAAPLAGAALRWLADQGLIAPQATTRTPGQ